MATPTPQHWKTDITDLRNRALACFEPRMAERMSARAAAACLSGIVGHVVRKISLDVAQQTCAELARDERTWRTSFGVLPHDNGYVSEATQLVATVARSLLPIAGADNLRAALSFWACEDDPRIWQSVAA